MWNGESESGAGGRRQRVFLAEQNHLCTKVEEHRRHCETQNVIKESRACWHQGVARQISLELKAGLRVIKGGLSKWKDVL